MAGESTYCNRLELGDVVSEHRTPRWANEELGHYTNDAIADYSMYFPLPRKAQIVTVQSYYTTADHVTQQRAQLSSAEPEYLLPDDILTPAQGHIISVWVGQQAYKDFRPKPGYAGMVDNAYYVRGNVLVIPDYTLQAQTIILEYDGIHDRVQDDLDEMTIPAADEGLLMWYITAKALMRESRADSVLRRWADKQDGGIHRNDNPLATEAQRRMVEYKRGIAIRLRPNHKRAYHRRNRPQRGTRSSRSRRR